MDGVHKVTRVEYHTLSCCPCPDCVAERSRRGVAISDDSRLRTISAKAAYLFGFIQRRSGGGSYLRQLKMKENNNE